MNGLRLRYDGKYDWIVDMDARSWTVVSHYIHGGRDFFKCTFTGAANLLESLGLNDGGTK